MTSPTALEALALRCEQAGGLREELNAMTAASKALGLAPFSWAGEETRTTLAMKLRARAAEGDQQ